MNKGRMANTQAITGLVALAGFVLVLIRGSTMAILVAGVLVVLLILGNVLLFVHIRGSSVGIWFPELKLTIGETAIFQAPVNLSVDTGKLVVRSLSLLARLLSCRRHSCNDLERSKRPHNSVADRRVVPGRYRQGHNRSELPSGACCPVGEQTGPDSESAVDHGPKAMPPAHRRWLVGDPRHPCSRDPAARPE